MKTFRSVLISAMIVLGLASCSTTESTTLEVGESTIIDVRSTEEYAAGHLEGAVNLNVEDGTLEDALATLDPNDSYIVYCRSGRRSEIAAQLMTDSGFATVTDLGSLESAAEVTGLPIVD